MIFEHVDTVTTSEETPAPKGNMTQRTVGRVFRHTNTKTSSNAEAPLSGEASRALKNLRLTSRRLSTLANRGLFRRISLSENLESWLNVASIAADQKLACYVEVLTLSMPQLCDTNCKDNNRINLKRKRPQNYPAHINVALFPFLKSIQCLKWKLVKVGAKRLPAKCFVIKSSPRMKNRGYLWKTAAALSDITAFGWEFQYLHLCLLDQTKAWKKYVKTLCISRLQTLDIDFKTDFSGWVGAHVMETILPMIEDLPCLKTFKLKQFYCGEDPMVHQDLAANVFRLTENHNWPGIQQLEVSRPRTRQEDFLGFLLRHKDTLQHLHYLIPEPSGALSVWMNDFDLERWIEQNISPTEPWVRY